MSALRLYSDLAALRMRLALARLALKYSPSQPRVPAGNSNGGQWTDGAQQMAAGGDGPLVPEGVFPIPVMHNPLDPKNLNPETMSLNEQMQVATAVNRVNSGVTAGMRGHTYKNRPNPETGAVLPPSVGGYRTYDVGLKSGAQRLLVDKITKQMYYTNNHYKSFWVIVPDTKSTADCRSTKVGHANN